MLVRAARPEDSHAIAVVHVASWQSTYRDLMPADFLAGLSIEAREATWRNNITGAARTFVLVAEDEGQIVGFAAGGLSQDGDREYQGEVYAIYVLDSYHRRGIGRALMREAARRLAAAGFETMLVWVLVDNPAAGFYEALGGKRLRTGKITLGGVELDTVAYGWANLRPLIAGE